MFTIQDKKMIVVDFTSSIPRGEGYNVRYKNPQYFDGRTHGVDYYKSTNPKIIEAFEKAGVPSWDTRKTKVEAPKPAPKLEPVVEKEEASIEDMSWNELRSAAKELTDEPIKSKDQAIKILKGE